MHVTRCSIAVALKTAKIMNRLSERHSFRARSFLIPRRSNLFLLELVMGKSFRARSFVIGLRVTITDLDITDRPGIFHQTQIPCIKKN